MIVSLRRVLPRQYVMRHAIPLYFPSLWQIDPIRPQLLVAPLSNFLQRCLAQHAIAGPARELDTRDQLRPGPMDGAAGFVRHLAGKRRLADLELLESRHQPIQQLAWEARSDTADRHQLLAFHDSEQK